MQDAAQFYNALATDYNTMTNATRRLEDERQVFAGLLQRLNIHRALEVGCGTGTQSFVLAHLGVEMAGSDISEGMIAQARTDADKMGLTVPFFSEDCSTEMHTPEQPYDAVFAIGNTLAHITEDDAMARTLANFRARLAPEGMVIVQLLNYERLLQRQERIINIRRNENRTYIRFYDFHTEHLIFNILTITDTNGKITHDLQSTRHTPWQRDALMDLAKPCGFSEMVTYGNLHGDPYEPQGSSNLVLVLR
jgi:glycine/sarcosine N-methyltransferase